MSSPPHKISSMAPETLCRWWGDNWGYMVRLEVPWMHGRITLTAKNSNKTSRLCQTYYSEQISHTVSMRKCKSYCTCATCPHCNLSIRQHWRSLETFRGGCIKVIVSHTPLYGSSYEQKGREGSKTCRWGGTRAREKIRI